MMLEGDESSKALTISGSLKGRTWGNFGNEYTPENSENDALGKGFFSPKESYTGFMHYKFWAANMKIRFFSPDLP